MVRAKSRGSRRQEFLRKGLDVLADDGPKSLSAARMARELKLTTGSFYWHFDSVPQFHDALRSYWRDTVIVELVREAKEHADDDPAKGFAKLRDLIQTRKTYRYDAAMRNWAKTNPDAERIVEAADAWRREVIADFIRATGAEEEKTRDRVNLFAAAWRGSEGMSDTAYRFKLMGLAASKD